MCLSARKIVRSHLKNRIFVQSQGGSKFQPAGILTYVEDLKRGPNAGFGLKDIFEMASKNSRGFTLIELMVVIVILGILAGLIVPRIMGRPEEAKQLKAKLTIESLETSLRLYKLDNGAYPTTEQGLNALTAAPDTGNASNSYREGGYIEKGKLPKDPWGNEFIYLSPGVHGEYDIISYGSDGVPGAKARTRISTAGK